MRKIEAVAVTDSITRLAHANEEAEQWLPPPRFWNRIIMHREYVREQAVAGGQLQIW